MRARVADARIGRLATITPDRHPHIVPCCFALAGDVLYSAVDAKPKSTLSLRRLANLRANTAASLLVDHYEEDWSTLWWVRVDGRGRVVEAGVERDRAIGVLEAKYAQYLRVPPPGAVVAIDVDVWRCWP